VDTWAGSDNVAHHLDYRSRFSSLFPVFAANVRRYGGEDVVRPIIRCSAEASRLFPDRSVDLVFIDGNHGYSQVWRDLASWLPKVKPGGILCGHDCDADYSSLPPALRSAMREHLEDDCYFNDRFAGPSAFHAGVVTAVHEAFGNLATRWLHTKRSTVWSLAVRMSRADRLRSAVLRHLPWLNSRRAALPVGEWPENI
jgi:hypothetical protein